MEIPYYIPEALEISRCFLASFHCSKWIKLRTFATSWSLLDLSVLLAVYFNEQWTTLNNIHTPLSDKYAHPPLKREYILMSNDWIIELFFALWVSGNVIQSYSYKATINFLSYFQDSWFLLHVLLRKVAMIVILDLKHLPRLFRWEQLSH
jgi:hypothetical protein